MNSCRVLFIGDANSIHIKKWVDYFVSKKYDVAVATFASENITNCKKIIYLSGQGINNTGGNYHYLLSVNKLSQFIKQYRPQYINAHYSYSMGLIGLLALKLSGESVSFSVVCHGSDILNMPHPRIYKLINKYVFKFTDKIFSVSSQITEVINKLDVDFNKIWTGQYGITFDNENNCSQRDIDIISTRNYVANSRIDEMLETLEHPFFVNKKIVFILPYITQEKINYFINKYPNITFYEKMPHEDLISLIKRSKIYISATKSDGTSLSLLEALAYGCYPVVSNITSNKDWIVNSVNGSMFYSFDEMRNILMDIVDKKQELFNTSMQINQSLVQSRAAYNIQMQNIEQFLIS